MTALGSRGDGFAAPDGAETIHLVVWVPWGQTASRTAAAVAVSDQTVRHSAEEGFWTLADETGSEADVAMISPPAPTA
jgi:hypothetical protein